MPKALCRLFCCIICGLNGLLHAQEPFTVDIQEVARNNAPAIHSMAYAQHGGRWLFIGGRLNGLHGFLPPLAFPNAGRQLDVVVYDPATDQQWAYPVIGLPADIREPLASSNMQFHQEGDHLYMVGGYGRSDSMGTFTTFPTLTVVNVPGLINAVTNSHPIDTCFRQIQDSLFAVCGGHLAKVDSTWMLVFGHRFEGIYDREDTSGFHVQRYTYAVRRFRLNDDGYNLNVVHLPTEADSLNYRRRDYNLVPQVFPDGTYGYTAFSGVFQKGINLPYLYAIDVRDTGATVVANFDQQLANYHCAVLPLHDSAANYMHTVFFGGEALYFYDSLGTLRMDTMVPFVNTVSQVTRGPSGALTEYRLGFDMPGLLGSNMQFIPYLPNVSLNGGIVRLNPLTGRTLVGHLMGGIESPLPNINDTDPAMSWASPRIFEVYVDKNVSGAAQPVEVPIRVQVSPNPFARNTRISIEAPPLISLKVSVLNIWGQQVAQLYNGIPTASTIHFNWEPEIPGGVYYLRTQSGTFVHHTRLLHASVH